MAWLCAAGNPVLARVHEHDAQDGGQEDRRPEDLHHAQPGGLDGDDLVVAGEPAVDDRHGEEERDRNRVGQGAGDDERDELDDVLGREQLAPMASAATMNSTKIVVMVRTASRKARTTSPETYRWRIFTTTASPLRVLAPGQPLHSRVGPTFLSARAS